MVRQAHHERRSEDFENALGAGRQRNTRLNPPVQLTRTHFVKPKWPTVIAKGAHPQPVIARSAAAHGEPVEPRGNLVAIEHTSANHHCYGDEIATPVSSTGSQRQIKAGRRQVRGGSPSRFMAATTYAPALFTIAPIVGVIRKKIFDRHPRQPGQFMPLYQPPLFVPVADDIQPQCRARNQPPS